MGIFKSTYEGCLQRGTVTNIWYQAKKHFCTCLFCRAWMQMSSSEHTPSHNRIDTTVRWFLVGARNIISHETQWKLLWGIIAISFNSWDFSSKPVSPNIFVWCTLKIHQSLSLTSFWCRWILTRHPFIKITWEKPTISIHSLILWFKHQNNLF